MARAPEPTIQPHQVVFEPDEVTFVDDRVTLTGRWFGVRGRRFMRPSLTLGRDGSGSRVLADLEHKPWNAEDGEPWTAAFAMPDSTGGADEVELAVAPDIAVVLQAPDELRARSKDRTPSRRRPAARRSAETTGARRGHGGMEMAASQAKVAELQAEITRLEKRLRQHDITQAELKAAQSRRDAAVSKIDTLLEERDTAVADRDAAMTARDAALAERDTVAAERDRALAAHERAVRERDTIQEERERAVRQREAIEHERDALGRRHREVVEAHEQLTQERDQLRAALAERQTPPTQIAQRPAPAPAPAPVPAPSPALAPVRKRRSPAAVWLTRGIALAVLLAAVIALLLIVQSV